MPVRREGFDKLGPNGRVASVPLALSLSKGRFRGTVGLDGLSPNGVRG
jgi:hypothetical protein